MHPCSIYPTSHLCFPRSSQSHPHDRLLHPLSRDSQEPSSTLSQPTPDTLLRRQPDPLTSFLHFLVRHPDLAIRRDLLRCRDDVGAQDRVAERGDAGEFEELEMGEERLSGREEGGQGSQRGW